MSSFFGQCGPNSATFIIPAKISPAEMQTTRRSIAAVSGKVGALLATIFFSHVEDSTDLFLRSGHTSLTAAAIAFCCVPEMTGLGLHKTDH